jgi:hypothetical protein
MTNSLIISKIEFAKMVGVSRPAITKACKADRLGMIGKKINLNHRKTQEYIQAQKERVNKPKSAPKKKSVKKPPPIKKPTPQPPEPEQSQELPEIQEFDEDDGYSLPAGIKRFEDITIHNLHLIPQDLIKKIKEFEQGAKAKQDRLVKRGELIERTVVKQVFARIHTTDSNQWKTLEDKLVPILCGIFDAQDGGPESIKARKTISDEVVKILRYNKRLIDNFFIENGVDD